MDVFLWILQVILAAVFLTLGLVKAVVPMEKLKKAINWTAEMPTQKVRIIGSLESLGGFGLFFSGLVPNQQFSNSHFGPGPGHYYAFGGHYQFQKR